MAYQMKSKRYFEYRLTRDKGRSTDASLGWSIQVDDINKADLYTDTDTKGDYEEEHPLSEATSDYGWITPYEWFSKKDSENVDTKDKTIHNGCLGIEARGDDKFKGKVWWCDDLRNWCVYESDCISDPYCNKFNLKVWNGHDGFEPVITYRVDDSDKDLEWKQWKPWQNTILSNIFQSGNTITHHRGMNGPDLMFGPGPLSLVESIVLQNADRYSINSAEQGFKAKREPRIRHIESESEFNAFDKLTKINVNGNTRYVMIKFRNWFTQKQGDLSKWFEGNPFLQKHCMDCVDTTTERSNTWDNFRMVDGVITWKEINHAKGFYNWDNDIYYADNNIDLKPKASAGGGADVYSTWKVNGSNQPGYAWKRSEQSSDSLKAYSETHDLSAPISPYDIRIFCNNHLCLSELSSEKIFAVYFYDENFNLCYQPMASGSSPTNEWNTQDAMKTTLHGVELTTYPVYMSYVDLEFLFGSLETMREAYSLHIPKCHHASGKDGIWDFTQQRWANANRRMLQKIAYAVYNDHFWSDHAVPEEGVVVGWQLVDDSNPTTQEQIFKNLNKIVDTRIVGGCSFANSNYFNIVFQKDATTMGILTWQTLKSKYVDGYVTQEDDYVGNLMMEAYVNTWFGAHEGIADIWTDQNAAVMVLTWSYMAVAEVATAVVGVVGFVVTAVASVIVTGVCELVGYHPVEKNTIPLPDSSWEFFTFSKETESGDTYKIDSTSRVGSTDYSLLVHKPMMVNILNSIGSGSAAVCTAKHVSSYISIRNTASFMHNFIRKERSNIAISNYREGVSIGNPAVWRLPSGEIALCTIMWWGGKNGLIGGPPDSDGDWDSCQSYADSMINGYCQEWFGTGSTKTIDDDWLKYRKHEMDEDSKDTGIIINGFLESGYVFEQINKECNETLNISLSTRRPLVYADVEVENVDVAKKW